MEISMKELLVGDLVPDFAFSEFLEGEPLWALARGTIHVIEFWASWCAPCVQAIPDLNRLQAQHPEIVVIGVVAMENDDKARAFVEKKRGEIRYRIALQAATPQPTTQGHRDSGAMTRDWLDASYSSGIPVTFLVDRSGRLAWIGGPRELEARLDELLAGRLDIAAAAEAYRREMADKFVKERFEVGKAFAAASKTRDKAEFFRLFDEAVAAHPQLETRVALMKLVLLLRDGEAGKDPTLAYARRVSDGVARNDFQTLLQIGVFLINDRLDGETRPQSASILEYATLGSEILERIEPRLGGEQPPSFWREFNSTLALGLAFAGRCEAALARIERARRFAAEAGLSEKDSAKREKDLAKLEEAEALCRGKSSLDRAPAPRATPQ
jgi:thiol-disulfide isomerase/thioredoxin